MKRRCIKCSVVLIKPVRGQLWCNGCSIEYAKNNEEKRNTKKDNNVKVSGRAIPKTARPKAEDDKSERTS